MYDVLRENRSVNLLLIVLQSVCESFLLRLDKFFVQVCMHVYTGLQLKNSEQNCFHDNFLISQPIPMMWETIPMSGHTIGIGWEK